MATNASIFIIIAPDENQDELTQEIVNDFERIIEWSKKNNIKVHTIWYNYIANDHVHFKSLLDGTKGDGIQKVLFPSNVNVFVLRSSFCDFMKTDGGKKLFFYNGHGGHICNIERKGFRDEDVESENTAVEHARKYGATPVYPTSAQLMSDHDNVESSETLAAIVDYIRVHGNSKTQETLWIPTSKYKSIEYTDDMLAEDISNALPKDDILYLVFDCCHAEGILNTWQVHGPTGPNMCREKKVVLFAAATTERMTVSGFTESFCKHARLGRKIYEIGKDIGDDMFQNPYDMYSMTKYSVENLCVTEF